MVGLVIHVVRAVLPPGTPGKGDLRVRLSMDGRVLKHTHDVPRASEVVWTDTCSVEVKALGPLELTVCAHHLMVADECLATATLALDPLVHCRTLVAELPLDDGGTLLVSVSVEEAARVGVAGRQRCPAIQDWKAIDTFLEAQHTQGMQEVAAAMECINPLNRDRGSSILLRTSPWLKPADGYEGPKLGWPLQLPDVVSLVMHYAKRGSPLWPGYVSRIVSEAICIYERQDPVVWVTSRSGQHTQLVVVGDLHGHLKDLLNIFGEFGFPSPTGSQYLFNGDFVDRGTEGVEVAVLILAFKLLYPESVRLNRGNHESELMNAAFGFADEVERKYPDSMLGAMFSVLWNMLPLATVIDDDIAVVHGGLFRDSGVKLAHLKAVPKQECTMTPATYEERLLVDVLWSDPVNHPGRTESDRGPGILRFGPDVTRAFLERNKLRLLIRSHQVPSTGGGFEWLHDHQCVTVFSASNYCGTEGNLGGVLILPGNGHIHCHEYFAPPLTQIVGQLRAMQGLAVAPRRLSINLSSVVDMERRAHQQVLRHLCDGIRRRHTELGRAWQACEEVAPGRISMDDWQKGLQTQLGLKIDLSTYEADLLPPGEETVDWRAFLASHEVQVGGDTWASKLCEDIQNRFVANGLPLTAVFQIFCRCGAGTIPMDVLREELSAGLDLQLTEEQVRGIASTLGATAAKPLTVGTLLEALDMHYTGTGHMACADLQVAFGALERTLAKDGAALCELLQGILDGEGGGAVSVVDMRRVLQLVGDSDGQPIVQEGLAEVMMTQFGAESSRGTFELATLLGKFRAEADRFLAYSQAEALAQATARALGAQAGSLRLLFAQLDADGDGYLAADELSEGLLALVRTLGLPLTPAQVGLLTRHVDMEGDGRISRRAFLRAFEISIDEEEEPHSGGSRTGPLGWAQRFRKTTAALLLPPASPTKTPTS